MQRSRRIASLIEVVLSMVIAGALLALFDTCLEQPIRQMAAPVLARATIQVPPAEQSNAVYACATMKVTCTGTTCNTQTCFNYGTCNNSSTCSNASTCNGAHTCNGGNTCNGGSTCTGSSTCNNTQTCSGGSTCDGYSCNDELTCMN